MRAHVVRPDELGDAQRERWRQLCRAHGGLENPFLSVEFAIAVGRVRADARVAVLEDDGGDVVGFLPFQQGRFGVGRALGAGVSDCQALIVAPGAALEARELLTACDLAVWEFDHLLAGQAAWLSPRSVTRSAPIIELRRGFPAYLEERRRASSTVRTALKRARRTNRALGELRFEPDSRDLSALRLLMRWKSDQYRRTGRRDRFARVWTTALVEDLFDRRPPGCAGQLSVLWAGDRIIALQFSLRSDDVLALWFPAYDLEAARYSPGWQMYLRLAEKAAGDGVARIELGKGDEAHKSALKTGDLLVAEGCISRPGATAAARAVQRAPRRRAEDFVLGRPALRLAARRALREVGRFREAA